MSFEVDKQIRLFVQNDDVESLVELGLTNEEKLLVVTYACKMGSIKTLKVFLKQVNVSDCKENLLVIATEKKNIDTLQELCSCHRWKKDKIETAYACARNNEDYGVLNFIYFLTGYWFNPER